METSKLKLVSKLQKFGGYLKKHAALANLLTTNTRA